MHSFKTLFKHEISETHAFWKRFPLLNMCHIKLIHTDNVKDDFPGLTIFN